MELSFMSVPASALIAGAAGVAKLASCVMSKVEGRCSLMTLPSVRMFGLERVRASAAVFRGRPRSVLKIHLRARLVEQSVNYAA
jgi:hypothetical protein